MYYIIEENMRWQDFVASTLMVVFGFVVSSGTTTTSSQGQSQGHPESEEEAGEGRVLASFYFPFFPQYHGVNYGDTLEFLTQSDTIGYFVIRDIITVRTRKSKI